MSIIDQFIAVRRILADGQFTTNLDSLAKNIVNYYFSEYIEKAEEDAKFFASEQENVRSEYRSIIYDIAFKVVNDNPSKFFESNDSSTKIRTIKNIRYFFRDKSGTFQLSLRDCINIWDAVYDEDYKAGKNDFNFPPECTE